MKKITTFFILLINLNAFSQTQLFDDGWRFHRGGAQSAETVDFDDSQWRMIDLPHDWSIEDLPGTDSPFDRGAVSQTSGGFTIGGTGWYRKAFSLPESMKGKLIQIQFDGVYMNAECWLNGQSLGNHPYGYTTFWFDVTSKVRFDTVNVLAVQVKNEGANSRWYSGSGIYRHVWLKAVDQVHVVPFGVYITFPEVSSEKATVKIVTTVGNKTQKQADIKLVTKIVDGMGREVTKAESVIATDKNKTSEAEQVLSVAKPGLWSVETPVLYKAVTEVYADGKLCDKTETSFGIRIISFSVDKGFQLNGNIVKLKGGCVHHDNGPLGAKAYDRAEERRIELLKASGYNAVRCSHNPPSPAFLAACDKLGMLSLIHI